MKTSRQMHYQKSPKPLSVNQHGAKRPLLKALSACVILLWSLLIGGCTSWYIMSTPAGQPVDQNIGERTFGSKIEDMNIEAKINANLFKASQDYRKADVTVTSYNGIVLLTGTVPNQSLKLLAEKIADDTRRVRQVHNKLEIGNNLSAGQKAKDGWLRLKVKTKLLTSRHVPGKRIEVITSNNVAYLMGLLSPIETKRATQSIDRMPGLTKIVKIFEYIAPTPYAYTESHKTKRTEPQRSQPADSGRRLTFP